MALRKIPENLIKAYLQRYPVNIRLARFNWLNGYTWLQPTLAEIQDELFPPEPERAGEEKKAIAEPVSLPAAAGVHFLKSPYKRYRCEQGDHLSCRQDSPIPQEEQETKDCSVCGFPALLPEKTQFRGQRGTYQIQQQLGRRGIGRLYAVTQLGVNQSVVCKEYLLPDRYFNPQEIRQQTQAFKNLAGFNLADGRVQDLRFVEPLEAITDQSRCYLVMDERYGCPTLNQYLTQGAMSVPQVTQVLRQVLQTLEFIHGQKFCFPSGQVQNGVVHGNLSLDTLLLVRSRENGYELGVNKLTDLDFFIYLCDLAVWERLFDPPLTQEKTTVFKSQDLVALGYIAFYLLAGKVVTDTGQPLDPQNLKHWPEVDPPLKKFIFRLMELDLPFESATAARQELLRLPQKAIASTPDIPEEESPRNKFALLGQILLLSTLGLGIIGGLAWLLLPKLRPTTATELEICCIKDVSGIPPGQFTYTAAKNGIGSYILQQPDLIQKGQTLEAKITAAQPQLQLTYQPANSTAAAIAQVESGQAAFAIAPLVQPLPPDLLAEAIGYDGLGVFVAFSYSQRENGLPVQLNGEISLEQLRQLYGGQVGNWSQLGGSRLPVELYQPTDLEATNLFTQRVLENQQPNRTQTLPEFEMMRKVIQDFELQQTGGIGFGSLSKIVGQCSVYPLALKIPGKPPTQAVILSNGQAISPKTDLCAQKGNYHLNGELFKTGRYPLAYPIAVIYPRDNDRSPIGEKFAQMLKTREGQRLLHQTGLVGL